jgi:hypothetical protein
MYLNQILYQICRQISHKMNEDQALRPHIYTDTSFLLVEWNGVWTKSLELAKQVLDHLSHTSNEEIHILI